MLVNINILLKFNLVLKKKTIPLAGWLVFIYFKAKCVLSVVLGYELLNL